MPNFEHEQLPLRHLQGLTLEEAARIANNQRELPAHSEPPLGLTIAPAELRAKLIEMARLYHNGALLTAEVHMNLKDWAKRLRVTKESLWEDFKIELNRLESEQNPSDEERPSLTEDELKAAKEFGKQDLVEAHRKGFRSTGYVANRINTLALMHTMYARLLKQKTGWLHYGASRSGKSAGLDAAFKLVHPANRMRATSMTAGAVFSLGHLEHKFILCGELQVYRPGEDDLFQRVMRQFISEAEITHVRLEERQSNKGSQYTRTTHTVSGFAAVAWTSTRDPHEFKDEFALRLTSIPSNEDEATTNDVMDLKLSRAEDSSHSSLEENVVKQFNNFDLSLEALDVTIPFAKRIKPRNRDTSMRGIVDLMILHIEISALINQHARKRDANGKVIAEQEDYDNTYLLVNLGAHRVQAVMGNAATESFGVLRSKIADLDAPLTIREIGKHTGKHQNTVKGYIDKWIKADLIAEQPRYGKNARKFVILDSADASTPSLGLIPPEEVFSGNRRDEYNGVEGISDEGAENTSSPEKPVRTQGSGVDESTNGISFLRRESYFGSRQPKRYVDPLDE